LDGVDGMSAWVLVDQSKPDAPLGHVDLTCSGTEARLGRVIIDPERRGEGLGSTLVNLALDKARELGIIRVDLNVIVGNVPAIRTYERLGFVAQDWSERPDVILMATDLDTVESAR
jgi:ribosomal protein S18 acetylase RimI-like enzyme